MTGNIGGANYEVKSERRRTLLKGRGPYSNAEGYCAKLGTLRLCEAEFEAEVINKM